MKAADDPAVVICTHVVAPHSVLSGQVNDHVSTCTFQIKSRNALRVNNRDKCRVPSRLRIRIHIRKDPHRFWKLDLDPHWREKLYPDPHWREKLDPDLDPY